MPAVPAIVMVSVVVPSVRSVSAASTAVHNDATGLAELRPLCLHTGRDFSNVRNEIAAQPHRVRRASLTGGVIALSRGAVQMIK